MPNLISIDGIGPEVMSALLDRAASYTQTPPSGDELRGSVVALLFFEPSTRTQLSFASAAQRLGAGLIGFQDLSVSSAVKGESLEDTARVVGSYAEAIVIRHSEAGSADRAALATNVPVINAGDGSNEHPTQTLGDMLTIQRRHGRLTDLDVGFAGDLLHGRTVHSLSKALAPLGNRFHYIAPESLQAPAELVESVEEEGTDVQLDTDLRTAIPKLDVLYMTRPQKERWADTYVAEESWVLTPELMQLGKETLAVMHPLPRNEEIDARVDTDPRAAYFEQAACGVPVRMAVLMHAMREATAS